MTRFRDGQRGDRPLLQAFRCTSPPELGPRGHRLQHARPWEAEVEGHFHDLKPPGRPENLIRLGFDNNDDLASIIEVERLKPLTPGAEPEYFVRAMAIAQAHRGHGGATADDAITDALRAVAHRVAADNGSSFIVSGRIHQHNAASQAMAARHGIEPAEPEPGDPYTRWRTQIRIVR